ncbi:Uncharacterized protein Rs2_47844 [Raphanus sativus]|nr:Uncharacterized protein Rs2_47844 [Raphanus sativus]
MLIEKKKPLLSAQRITTPAGFLLPPHRSTKLLNPLTITPYPKLDPNDVNPPPSPISGNAAITMPSEFNPYVFPSTVPKNTMDSVKDTLGNGGRWLQTPPRRLKISLETFGTFGSTVKEKCGRVEL